VGNLKWWQEVIFVFKEKEENSINIEFQHIKNDIWLDGLHTENILGSTGNWDSGIWDVNYWDQAPYAIYRMKDLGNSQAIKFRISTKTPTSAFELKSIDIYYKPQAVVRA
jgi:hypothetical protein